MPPHILWNAYSEAAASAPGCDELHRAAHRGDAGAVRRLLENRGVPDTRRDLGGWTPLHIAAGRGHIAAVEQLLASRADPEAVDRDGRTPRQWADWSGCRELGLFLRLHSQRAQPEQGFASPTWKERQNDHRFRASYASNILGSDGANNAEDTGCAASGHARLCTAEARIAELGDELAAALSAPSGTLPGGINVACRHEPGDPATLQAHAVELERELCSARFTEKCQAADLHELRQEFVELAPFRARAMKLDDELDTARLMERSQACDQHPVLARIPELEANLEEVRASLESVRAALEISSQELVLQRAYVVEVEEERSRDVKSRGSLLEEARLAEARAAKYDKYLAVAGGEQETQAVELEALRACTTQLRHELVGSEKDLSSASAEVVVLRSERDSFREEASNAEEATKTANYRAAAAARAWGR
mmetsp:Transcript_54435/g.151634  ORF Transcript_54435/g.151634 Transcript_54435/m.151634 type:complete len:425 (+) Transcript_54435:57-1331(+)